ncbi:MAG: hypothetical protein SFX18_05130 [Pirellulales bacterium]|nr:hypothetical protein [Pirellulales bacterium]
MATKNLGNLGGFAFLNKAFTSEDVPGLCALFGDEPFLQRECLKKITELVLEVRSGKNLDAEFSVATLNGEKNANQELELRTVLDELNTVSLFGGTGRRLVVIDQADDFITLHRDELLSKYVQRPNPGSVLVLVVKTWPSNTKLYKEFAANGLNLECKTPGEDLLLAWLVKQASTCHGAQLEREAAELLLEIVGPEMGRLDQELEKLSLIVLADQIDGQFTAEKNARTPPDPNKIVKIDKRLVLEAVGGWQAKSAWDLGDRINEGDAATALLALQRLIDAGEDPIALVAMLAGTIRKYAAATRVADLATGSQRRLDMKTILTEAGMKIWPDAQAKAERHLKQLTRARGRRLLGWLLQADAALKGHSSSKPRSRYVLETLIVRMSKMLSPPTNAS